MDTNTSFLKSLVASPYFSRVEMAAYARNEPIGHSYLYACRLRDEADAAISTRLGCYFQPPPLRGKHFVSWRKLVIIRYFTYKTKLLTNNEQNVHEKCGLAGAKKKSNQRMPTVLNLTRRFYRKIKRGFFLYIGTHGKFQIFYRYGSRKSLCSLISSIVRPLIS